ncbi:Antibiotic biosynthesis monooxygenase [Kribbella flavida DSM 17836]|uniref:Antibiotic biosynthesis monooxygenase n=1 Tax=Kribbella flavida (strain DSM 17836 / JCM 10339 / NBRC 14399) TaxID=479435 RepID=D2PY87_KRIFD|nr:antibiotic biosynthesis monooxygenase [Kribbella flavida]ADB35455.1 Antibiotic biosynthesis monooxygenase [Kribbella flavida DSM 17836]
MGILVRVEFVVRDGREQDFAAVVRALAARVAEEPGTLKYDWYQGPGYVVVLEEYTDAAAAIGHNEHVADLLAQLFALADMTLLQLHGDVTPELQKVLDGLPAAQVFPPLG